MAYRRNSQTLRTAAPSSPQNSALTRAAARCPFAPPESEFGWRCWTNNPLCTLVFPTVASYPRGKRTEVTFGSWDDSPDSIRAEPWVRDAIF